MKELMQPVFLGLHVSLNTVIFIFTQVSWFCISVWQTRMLLCLCATLALSLTRGWRSRLVPLPRYCAAMNTAQGSLWYAVLCVDSQEGYSWAIWRSIFSLLGSLHVIFIVAAQVRIQTRSLYGSRFPTFSPRLLRLFSWRWPFWRRWNGVSEQHQFTFSSDEGRCTLYGHFPLREPVCSFHQLIYWSDNLLSDV